MIVESLDIYRKLNLTEKQQIFYDFMIENGETFTKRNDIDLGKKRNLSRMIQQNECFKNSMLTSINTKFDYYEGYYMTENIPIHLEHAFNKDSARGEIYDITAQKFDIPVSEWFGVKVPREIFEIFLNSKYNGMMSPLQYYVAHYIIPQKLKDINT
ncbi:hypothetical protein J2810_004583 [Chryseobacterium rhizosphaerae]|uniref:hypothetical protein n=1 Tax=Chryseobacterium rhizosphaerae TaxID=395937 RepID=UPI0028593553|nr:hypothetical protein [Chryseobacterium rhizosphaerae]MDR6548493.1 hypothetical protein [Chryseobacterium rhizosphaerae]